MTNRTPRPQHCGHCEHARSTIISNVSPTHPNTIFYEPITICRAPPTTVIDNQSAPFIGQVVDPKKDSCAFIQVWQPRRRSL